MATSHHQPDSYYVTWIAGAYVSMKPSMHPETKIMGRNPYKKSSSQSIEEVSIHVGLPQIIIHL